MCQLSLSIFGDSYKSSISDSYKLHYCQSSPLPPSQSAWQQESVDHWRARRPSRLLSRLLQRPGGLCDADDDGGAVVDDDDGRGDGVWECDGMVLWKGMLNGNFGGLLQA